MGINLKKSFFIGIIAALVSLVLEYLIIILKFPTVDRANANLFGLILIAVLIEEAIKLAIVYKITAGKDKKFIFLAAIIFGIGFSFSETAINVYSLGDVSGNILAYLSAALIHLTTCSIYGNTLAFWQKKAAIVLAFFIAYFLHFGFNITIIREYVNYTETTLFFLSLFAFTWIVFYILNKKRRPCQN